MPVVRQAKVPAVQVAHKIVEIPQAQVPDKVVDMFLAKDKFEAGNRENRESCAGCLELVGQGSIGRER